MKIELTTEEIEKPGVATALSTLFAAVAGSFTTCPKDSAPRPERHFCESLGCPATLPPGVPFCDRHL
jgi:hypothetical protein